MRTGSRKLSPAGIEPTFKANIWQIRLPLVKNTSVNAIDSLGWLIMF